jgi:hypothetical protein
VRFDRPPLPRIGLTDFDDTFFFWKTTLLVVPRVPAPYPVPTPRPIPTLHQHYFFGKISQKIDLVKLEADILSQIPRISVDEFTKADEKYG